MRSIAFALAVSCLPLPLLAQTAPGLTPSVEGAVFYATVNGDSFSGTKAGVGFDGQLRLGFSAPWSLGVGYQRSSHEVTGLPDNAIFTGVFLEPRFAIALSGSPMTPYLVARVGTATETLTTDLGNGREKFKATGWLAGFGGGLGFKLGSAVGLNLSAMYAHVSLGDGSVNGQTVSGSGGTGSTVILRAGLNYAFGLR